MILINHSARSGEPGEKYVLGPAHFNGDHAANDWPRAYALTKRASDAGLAIASARLVQPDHPTPHDQRQRGLAMIPALERREQRARPTAVRAAAPPPPKPAPPPPTQPPHPPAARSAAGRAGVYDDAYNHG